MVFQKENFDEKCAALYSANFINNCNFTFAYDKLNHLYKDDLIKLSSEISISLTGQFITSKQAAFMNPSVPLNFLPSFNLSIFTFSSITLSGTIACNNERKYSIHVALYGCKQSKSFISNVFVKKAGRLKVAELNNIIVLFPQVIQST
ncbi:unnamed protein product [Rotaria sordida]|uniref:Uncharacterized protein n=1 Tax=Rotaria sordida TaxID=392033 RepID=A0A819TMY6_9BILA|nr:unnamed protein product [Rotaria sordida]